MGRLGAETGDRKWLASLHRQAYSQFRLPHPQLRVKQQQLRLATVTGTGRKNLVSDYTGSLKQNKASQSTHLLVPVGGENAGQLLWLSFSHLPHRSSKYGLA